MSFTKRIADRLQSLQAEGLARDLPPVSHRRGVAYRLGDRGVVGFCSNDYLGLAEDTAPLPGHEAPSGAGGSRLICGDLPLHRTAERQLAALVGAPDAVLFPSGFQLNVGVLPLVVEPDDVVYSDQLNHASLIDGLRLSSARPRIVPHATVPPLEPHPIALRWWIAESIFSMDGDRVDVAGLTRFTDEGGCTYVDEAHAIGLFAGGRGLLGTDQPLPSLLVGTLSKAFGCGGAFVAGPAEACHYIRTRARSFVFSTGVSPALVSRILQALDRVTGPEGDRRREALWANTARLADAVGVRGTMPSPIFPLIVGDNTTAVALANALLDRGFHVQPIRPPTVPRDTARLRITVTAAHTAEQIDALGVALRELFDRHGRPLRVERGNPSPPPRVSGTPIPSAAPHPPVRRA